MISSIINRYFDLISVRLAHFLQITHPQTKISTVQRKKIAHSCLPCQRVFQQWYKSIQVLFCQQIYGDEDSEWSEFSIVSISSHSQMRQHLLISSCQWLTESLFFKSQRIYGSFRLFLSTSAGRNSVFFCPAPTPLNKRFQVPKTYLESIFYTINQITQPVTEPNSTFLVLFRWDAIEKH